MVKLQCLCIPALVAIGLVHCSQAKLSSQTLQDVLDNHAHKSKNDNANFFDMDMLEEKLAAREELEARKRVARVADNGKTNDAFEEQRTVPSTAQQVSQRRAMC